MDFLGRPEHQNVESSLNLEVLRHYQYKLNLLNVNKYFCSSVEKYFDLAQYSLRNINYLIIVIFLFMFTPGPVTKTM